MTSSIYSFFFMDALDHNDTRTLGRTPLDEGRARPRNLYQIQITLDKIRILH